MSWVSNVGYVGGWVLGAITQVVNSGGARVPIPMGGVAPVPIGDVLEPAGDAARDGATAVEHLIDRLTGVQRGDANAARATRPLLAQATVTSAAATDVTRLTFRATAPGCDWSAGGRTCAPVAIYVDGAYQSTVLVLAERDGSYEVGLGPLAPGVHSVELRFAPELVGTPRAVGAAAPALAPPVVTSVSQRTVTGDQALVDRYAPVFELRADEDGTGVSATHSDTPLAVVPAIQRHPDGSRTIEYRVLYSNEDGGTSLTSLLTRYGRGIDAEPAYRVTIDAAGRVVSETYQSAIHRWLAFDGERVGSRPVLRVSTANNMVSARTHGPGAERWSEAPLAPVDATTSEYEVMRTHGWIWQVSSKELVREGRSAVGDAERGARQIGDPRQYVYLGPLADAARAAMAVAGGVTLVLKDGRRVLARALPGFAEKAFHQTALELPPGVTADLIRAVALLNAGAPLLATVLDGSFLPHELEELLAA